jgi:hypothetical protein
MPTIWQCGQPIASPERNKSRYILIQETLLGIDWGFVVWLNVSFSPKSLGSFTEILLLQVVNDIELQPIQAVSAGARQSVAR